MGKRVEKNNSIFQYRLEKHHDELRWLYMELYQNDDMFAELCSKMYEYYRQRSSKLKERDAKREQEAGWYHRKDMLGMMLYIDNFAGNMQGVKEKIPYLKECNINCLHLMPFLDTPEGRSDGGYAVADFRKVRPDLGTMKDLAELTEKCHEEDINVCMDFVMNHTSEDHEWAKRARDGEGEYMSRYFFYDNDEIPKKYEETVPQVFPTTAPGNFTYLPENGHYVMTTFYPYQWDLNYRNPRVFNEMMYNFLYLTNQGIDIVRIDAVPYIWKELGTTCRNLKQVHTIVRMMRMIAEIVCPSVLLLGEVVMEPEKVVPYFGTIEKPECHMLYNVTTMATTWNSIAARDIRLLKKQMDILNHLPKQYVFLNYLRCHDDIGWGLDYETLKQWGMEEIPHKRYLNDYFTGKIAGSISRGELYNDDPVTQDARFCGTTASMCGIEKAGFEQNKEAMETAVREDLMLHAYMLTQSGIPMLYSGDELGQVNDYSYKEDPAKCADSRYIHRGKLQWELAENKNDPTTVQGSIFQTLDRLEKIRRQEITFDKDADVYTYDVHDDSVLCILREYKG
ncbi:MAG: alpha-amylase family protein, partial [Dorea sp.]